MIRINIFGLTVPLRTYFLLSSVGTDSEPTSSYVQKNCKNIYPIIFTNFVVFFHLYLSLPSHFFPRPISLPVILVCIRHFSLSAVLCLILAHRGLCQPKQEIYYRYCIHTRTPTLCCNKFSVTVSKYGQRYGRVVGFLKSVFAQLYEDSLNVPHCNHNVQGGAGEGCQNVV